MTSLFHLFTKNMKPGLPTIALLLAFAFSSTGATKAQTLDAYWAEVSRTVNEGDFEGYAGLYHEDAVLVSNASQTSVPISTALAGWKQGFIDTQEGKMAAEVTFRFSQRYSDSATAHETGIFRYVATPADGEASESLVHFEGLLVKKDGWKMVMEFQYVM